jgi:hypothetical protein
MAQLIWLAKSESKWIEHDLYAFNITIQSENTNDFFGNDHVLSLDGLDTNLFSPNLVMPDTSELTCHIINSLTLALTEHLESHTNSFAFNIMQVMGFEDWQSPICEQPLLEVCNLLICYMGDMPIQTNTIHIEPHG